MSKKTSRGFEFQINQLVAGIQQRSDAAACVDLVVTAALGADLLIVFQISLEDVLLAALALDPQALGADTLLLRAVFNLVVLPLEPSHPSIMPSAAGRRLRLVLSLIFEASERTDNSMLVDSLACALSWTMYSFAPVRALPRPRNLFGSGYARDRQIGIPDKAQRVVVSPS